MKWVFVTIQVTSSLILLGSTLALLGLLNHIEVLYKWGASGGMAYPTAILFFLTSLSVFLISIVLLWYGTILQHIKVSVTKEITRQL